MPYQEHGPALHGVLQEIPLKEVLMDPVRILQVIVENLADNPIDDESLVTGDPEYVEEIDNGAEVRVSWGGPDLFDITIKRV